MHEFLCKTLSISNRVILYAFSMRDELGYFLGQDKRGKHIPADDEIIKKVKQHIESFPIRKGHYSRKHRRKRTRSYVKFQGGRCTVQNDAYFVANCRGERWRHLASGASS